MSSISGKQLLAFHLHLNKFIIKVISVINFQS